MKKIGKLFLVGMMTFIGMMLSMKVQAADMPANPVDKPGYTLDYADEFNGDSLDKSKWTDYYLPHWSKNPENAKANYRFENGCLVEYITKDQQAWSPECIFRKNRALAPHERSAVPLGTDHCPVC